MASFLTLIDASINALTYMSTKWHDLVFQYSAVLGHINKASKKADLNKFEFLKPNLNAAIKRIKSGNCFSTKIGEYWHSH